ncbi:MAG TPA: sigma-70 family RNA polymerase sigma factor [Xanthobacteraceae bacterium]|nr:sigma-70 family RNA polymerase sigma factor [Xanthobacteraceae bacterium]
MTNDSDYERLLASMRPKLHRYCARMTGSAVDGEDVVQEVLIKALSTRSTVADIGNIEGWLFRIAHNASLDFLRARARSHVVPFSDEMEVASDDPDPDVAAVSFRTFLELPALQRCAVVFKDVLGHSVEEIAEIAGCSVPAAKSALQRGRSRLKELMADGADAGRLPLLPADERRRLQHYVALFKSGELDMVRQMLADDVRLDLVNRLKLTGRKEVGVYFARYAEATHWRFALGAVDGEPAMLVYDSRGPMERPAHFVVLEWRADEVATIKDFCFAPYAMEGCDWVWLD